MQRLAKKLKKQVTFCADLQAEEGEEKRVTSGRADVWHPPGNRVGVPTVARILQLFRCGTTAYVDEDERLYVLAAAQGGTPSALNMRYENEYAYNVLLSMGTGVYPKGCELYWVIWRLGVEPADNIASLDPEVNPTEPIALRNRNGAKVFMLVLGNGVGSNRPGTRERKTTYAILDRQRRQPPFRISVSPPTDPT